ncbi:hypothetical protein BZA77DRAFT_301437 [Pyronema omphalodes]|nr:hypothetical protein BZA77DRAFT_301437 [Pyronema omphalodes]
MRTELHLACARLCWAFPLFRGDSRAYKDRVKSNSIYHGIATAFIPQRKVSGEIPWAKLGDLRQKHSGRSKTDRVHVTGIHGDVREFR